MEVEGEVEFLITEVWGESLETYVCQITLSDSLEKALGYRSKRVRVAGPAWGAFYIAMLTIQES